MSIGYTTIEPSKKMSVPTSPTSETTTKVNVVELRNENQHEVLSFLFGRPIHTVCMISYVRDNGIESPLNRGTFYGCRNEEGRLEGVALIGHATLVETQNDEALKAFAELNREHADSHLIRGEHSIIERYWKYYSELRNTPHLKCRELLFQQTEPPKPIEQAPDLRQATIEDIHSIIRINAQMIISECGIDPLIKDPAGFYARVTRRIEMGRIWVWTKRDSLVFKADVFAETREMSYLEGIYVHPFYRGMGNGLRCMNRLSNILLQRSRGLCLMINEEKPDLCNFYKKVGFVAQGAYDTIYLDAQLTNS
jgi:predicted GNAT family acetyltransferase